MNKAIDLMDEAASRLRIEIDSMPMEIDVLDRRTKQLEIEKAALSREIEPESRAFESMSLLSSSTKVPHRSSAVDFRTKS